MPKLNPVGIAVASIAFFLIGFLWYGILFAEAWMTAEGLTEEDAGDPVSMLGGFLITVMQVLGLAIVLKWKGVEGTADAASAAAFLWAVLALPLALYDFVYLPAHDLKLLMIDAGHLLIGWVVSAAVLSRFK